MELQNKVVLITGSSSGIGQTTAIAFAKEGAKVVVNYKENAQGAEETLLKIKEVGAEGLVVQADVSKHEDIKKLFDETLTRFNTLDILINNAAISVDTTSFEEVSVDHIQNLFLNNVASAMICSQEALKIFKEKGGGRIINTSSIKGIEYGGGGILYAATKAAINSFTKSLAKKAAPKVLVNAVAPGYVKTRSYDGMAEDKIKSYLDSTYLKRWVSMESVVDAYIFLAKNDDMTGQVIYVDAGFTLK